MVQKRIHKRAIIKPVDPNTPPQKSINKKRITVKKMKIISQITDTPLPQNANCYPS